MIVGLTISNFKAFAAEQRLQLAPLTLLYGPNSGGKSSVMQALLLLKQSLTKGIVKHGLVSREALVDLGGFASFVHRHESARPVVLGLETQTPDSFPLGEVRKGRVLMRFEGRAASDGHLDGKLAELTYQIDDARNPLKMSFMSTPTKYDWKGPPDVFRIKDSESLQAYEDYCTRARLQDPLRGRDAESEPSAAASAIMPDDPDEQIHLYRSAESHGLPDLLSSSVPNDPPTVDFSRESRAYSDAAFVPIADDVSSSMQRLRYLGPLRAVPTRLQPLQEQLHEDAGLQGENLANVIWRRPRDIAMINAWLARMNLGYQIGTEILGNATTGRYISISMTDSNGLRVTPADVGFGVGQFLPILLEGIMHQSSCLCVEQPEIHLHPRLQAELADFFIFTGIHGWLDLESWEKHPLSSFYQECIVALGEATKEKSTHNSDFWSETFRLTRDFMSLEEARGRTKDEALTRYMRLLDAVKARQEFERKPNHWIIETHSETLMLRLQRRIREGAIKASDVVVYYIEPGAEGSRVIQLRLDEDGAFIDEWPGGFFEDGFNETFGWRH